MKLFLAQPSLDNLTALCGAVNICENAVHNNGFFLNKFLDKRAFDIGTNPSAYLSLDPKLSFAIFMSARDAWLVRDIKKTKPRNISTTLNFAIKYSRAGTKMKKPLFSYSSLPKSYRVVEEKLVKQEAWGKFHTYSVTNPKMCGSSKCSICKDIQVYLDTHKQKEEQKVKNAMFHAPIPKILKTFEMFTPYDEADIIDTSGETVADDWYYETIDLINAALDDSFFLVSSNVTWSDADITTLAHMVVDICSEKHHSQLCIEQREKLSNKYQLFMNAFFTKPTAKPMWDMAMKILQGGQ